MSEQFGIEIENIEDVWVAKEPIRGLIATDAIRDRALVKLGKLIARTDDFVRQQKPLTDRELDNFLNLC